jgi:predicted DNA-binding transcriptional regulator YafY
MTEYFDPARMQRLDDFARIVESIGREDAASMQSLADELQISVDSVPRRVAEMRESGIPIVASETENVTMSAFELPSMALTVLELGAVVSGLELLSGERDSPLRSNAATALDKLSDGLPSGLSELAFESPWREMLSEALQLAELETLEQLGTAVIAKQKVRISYQALDGGLSERVVQPLELTPSGTSWLLSAWCELRQDYRTFLAESMRWVEVLEEKFDLEGDVSLEGYRASRGQR